MNSIALFLVFTLVATAVIWYPSDAAESNGVREKVGEVAGEVKHAVEETVGKVKHTVNGCVKTKAGDLETGSFTKVAKEKVKGAVHSSKEQLEGVTIEALKTGNTLQKDVRFNSTEEFQIIRRYVVDFLNYLMPSRIWVSGSTSMKLLGLSVAYGTTVWVTFISSYITADALPRQQFAVLQSKIYPIYFKVIAYGIGMVLFHHCLSASEGLSIQALNLLFSLLVVIFNLKYLEPRANKLMVDTMKLEKEEGRGMDRPTDEPSVVRNIDSLVAPLGGKSKSAKASANPSEHPEERADSSAAARSDMVKLSDKLKKLNFYSSFSNIVILVSLTWHLLHLGQVLSEAPYTV